MKNRYIRNFLYSLIGCLIAILTLRGKWFNDPCDMQRRFDSLRFDGVVIRKYEDLKEHSVQTIELDQKGIDTIKLYFFADYKDLYSLINERDTIMKKRDDNHVYRRINSNVELVGKGIFGCKVKE